MALIDCPECNRKVSDSAEICPNCGYSIKLYIKKLEEMQKEADRKQKEEKSDSEIKNLKHVKRNSRKGKYINNKKRKTTIWGIAIILAVVAICIGIYMKATEEWRFIKSQTNDCIERLQEMQAEIFEKETIREGQYLYPYQYYTYSWADQDIAWVREKYKSMSASERTKYDKYLLNTHDTTFTELDDAFERYGLTSQTILEALEHDDEYYKNKLSELRNDDAVEPEGKIVVDDVSVSISGDNYYITGTVTNETKKTVYFVKVRITLEDKEGNVLNTDSTYAVGDEGLRPGETSVYECYTKYIAGADSVRAQIYDFDN